MAIIDLLVIGVSNGMNVVDGLIRHTSPIVYTMNGNLQLNWICSINTTGVLYLSESRRELYQSLCTWLAVIPEGYVRFDR